MANPNFKKSYDVHDISLGTRILLDGDGKQVAVILARGRSNNGKTLRAAIILQAAEIRRLHEMLDAWIHGKYSAQMGEKFDRQWAATCKESRQQIQSGQGTTEALATIHHVITTDPAPPSDWFIADNSDSEVH